MSSPRPTTSTIKLVFDEDDASFLFSSPSCEQPSMVLNIDETCSDTDLDELLDDEFPGSRVYRATVRSSKPGTAHDTPTIGMQLAVKLAAGAPAVRRIRHEALIYEKLLHQLQGTVVPQFYGMFTITVEGEEFGCLVMEWCEAPPTRPRSWPEIAPTQPTHITPHHIPKQPTTASVMQSEGETTSAEIAFDHATVCKLWSLSNTQPNITVKITPGQIVPGDEHPALGRIDKRVFRAVLETYNSPVTKETLQALPIDVAVKWARGKKGVDKLCYEAAIYQDYLQSIQGSIVPRFYGFYTATIDDVQVACLVLEWIEEDPKTSIDEDEHGLRQMRAMARLHQTRIFHGKILDDRHFLQDFQGNVRVVGFSTAQLHRCEVQGIMDNVLDDAPVGCDELYDVGTLIRLKAKLRKLKEE
ncbi:hypothetical protein B0H21DRAFT_720435 [Amylocystis lapponica]|nr:hypothetical protein B0H21DRAFT_720435 [Amylocystis lapponica]